MVKTPFASTPRGPDEIFRMCRSWLAREPAVGASNETCSRKTPIGRIALILPKSATSATSSMLTDEPCDRAHELRQRVFQVRRVVGARQDHPRPIGDLEPREDLRLALERRLRIARAVHEQHRNRDPRRAEGVELLV